jgi:holo-[acyl-carrier protein] synthase
MSLLGVDIEQITRIKKAVQKTPGFAARAFTPQERKYCAGRAKPEQHYAARFCAKEALCKALGVPLAWQEVEIKNETSGRPAIYVRGRTAKIVAGRIIRLSLTHAGGYAMAAVLVEDKQKD